MIARALPSCLTVGNLLLGIVSILLAFQDSWEYAAIMVIFGMILDGLDGRVARMLNTQSEFGKELDSLSDVISFGVAPAVTAIFPICGALRLARFNVHPGEPGYFIGLPITAAGGILATMALYHNHVPNAYFLMVAMLFLSFLMVSQIKYPTFKKVGIPKSAVWMAPLFLIVIAATAVLYPRELPKVLFIPLFLYALYGVKKAVSLKREEDGKKAIEEWK
jgi:CDP-diacylglycerol---serine O-phosphatidyltransferase